MSRKGLDQVCAQLHLLVEELKDSVEAELLLHLVCCLCSWQLSISLAVAVMVRAAAAAEEEDAAWPVLGWTAVGGAVRELSDQLLEQELAVMEAAVVRDVHGHP